MNKKTQINTGISRDNPRFKNMLVSFNRTIIFLLQLLHLLLHEST